LCHSGHYREEQSRSKNNLGSVFDIIASNERPTYFGAGIMVSEHSLHPCHVGKPQTENCAKKKIAASANMEGTQAQFCGWIEKSFFAND
jgi:hypothetical protein